MTILNDCRITKNSVFIGDQELPKWIAEKGVTVQPGGHRDINRVIVEFCVGEVVVEDPFTKQDPVDG